MNSALDFTNHSCSTQDIQFLPCNIKMPFWIHMTVVLLCASMVRSTPTPTEKNETKDGVLSSGWKPMVTEEALTTDEFAERLTSANSSELDSADTKRSFILVYPPRPSATEGEVSKAEAPPKTENLLRSDRHPRIRNSEGVHKIYQRPKFPPVANPPPLPEHALRNRQRIAPHFTPESSSNHQVQIQLLDGYIVPPASGGGASNLQAEKKAPQITTFPLNLNNVPEIRLLLPGDVHAQLNNLRHHPQQNRHSNAYTESQNSNGRNNNSPQRDYKPATDKNNIQSFESQRRPGRTVDYNNNNNRNSGSNGHTYGNGRPQQATFNQNQEPRHPNKDFSQPDPAIYPETVNFPGQNYQNSVNNPVSYNHVKPYTGDTSNNDGIPNRGRYIEEPKRDNRVPISQTTIRDTTHDQGLPQNYGGQQNPSHDNRVPISQTTIHDTTNGQGLPQNYGGQQNPETGDRTPISQTTIRDTTNGQGLPQNYGGQQNPATGNRIPISQTTIRDTTNGQGLPQNYGGQQNPATGDRTPISQTTIRDAANGQGYPQSYGVQRNPVTGNRTPISQTPIRDTTDGQGYPQSYGGQQNPVRDNRTPISQTKIHDLTNGQNFPRNSEGEGNSVPENRAHSKSHGTTNPNSVSPGFGGQRNPAAGNRSPVHSKTQGTVNVQSYSPNFRGQQNPAVDNRSPVHSKTQGTTNIRNLSPNYRGQQNPAAGNRSPGHSKTQGTTNVRSFSPNQQNPALGNRAPGRSKINGHSISPNFGGQRNPNHSRYNPGNTHPGQVPVEPFQRIIERENSKPPSNDNRNSNPSPENQNRDSSVTSYPTTKLNDNSNNNRNVYPNGWRATQPNRGKQNYNPVGGTPGKTNFYPGNSGNQNRNPQEVPQNGPSVTNFDSFGRGEEHEKSHGSVYTPSSPPQDQNRNPLEVPENGPSVTNFDSFGRGEEHEKSHGSVYTPSSNPQDQNRNPLEVPENGPSVTNFDSFGRGDEHEKSHGSAYSPSSSSQDNRNRGHDNTVSTSFDRGRIIAAENTETDKKPARPQGSTDDIYFVPPVLSQENVQTHIEPFGGPVSRDTDVATPVSTGRGDGLIDQKDISDYVNVNAGAGGGGMTFARTEYCECSQSCAPIQRSPQEDLGPSIREIARSLEAEAFFDFMGLTDEEIENTLASDGSYTLFLPSNEAVSRLPSNLIDHWRDNGPDLTSALLNHVVRDRVSLEQLKLGGRMTSRANDATIFSNNYNNEAVTVNGHRIVQGDVSAPKGGVIHVIDGTLCPVADQDIINTLRTCNKYDGFLTLADVTKLLETMQDEGPYTVFLPSNEALTKIPADELAILKENSTVLREFLEYHIVRGAYFSGDLKDGQFLTTLYQRQPIRMGIRVDGCYRRLVEANSSPLFKSDIPTKNGVIHVVDWILRPSDVQWCDGVILP